MYSHQVGAELFRFPDLRTLMARATPLRSGDQLAGIAAATDVERVAAQAALADLPMGMTAHIVFRALSDRPATQDPAMIALIRDRIGFDGLLMTDDLSMEALSGSIGDRTAASIAAGVDMALHCNGDMAEMRDCASHCGLLEGAALARADAALARRHAPDPVDIHALEAELDGLLRGRADG